MLDLSWNEGVVSMVLLSFIVDVAVLLSMIVLVWKRREPWMMFTAGMIFYATVAEIGKEIIHWWLR
jgi:hypothetical protein